MSEFVGPGPVALVFRGVQGGPWSRSNFNKMLAWPSAVRSLIGAEGLRRGGQSVREAAPYRGNAHGTYPDALPDLLTVLIVVIAPVGVDTVWPLPGPGGRGPAGSPGPVHQLGDVVALATSQRYRSRGGYAVGKNWESIANAFHGPTYIIAAVVVVALVVTAWRYRRRRSEDRGR